MYWIKIDKRKYKQRCERMKKMIFERFLFMYNTIITLAHMVIDTRLFARFFSTCFFDAVMNWFGLVESPGNIASIKYRAWDFWENRRIYSLQLVQYCPTNWSLSFLVDLFYYSNYCRRRVLSLLSSSSIFLP